MADYQALINSTKDPAKRAEYERLRNDKIKGMGTDNANGYTPTYNYNNYTPTPTATLRTGSDLAKNLGIDYNEKSILNKFNRATDEQYGVLDKQYTETENKFYDQMYGQQSTALDTIRKSQAQAIATGASRGLQMSNELSSMLGLQQESVAGATQLAQDRNLLNDKEGAAKALNAKSALETYNNLGLQMGTQAGNLYAADTEQNVGLMSYYASLNEADKNLQGTVYGADKNLEGNKYTADQNLTGTRYNADQNLIGSKYSADQSRIGQLGAASINAEATKYAANASASVQKAYYATQTATSPQDLSTMLTNAKSEDEYVAILVSPSIGMSEDLAKSYWKNKNVTQAQNALNGFIAQTFEGLKPMQFGTDSKPIGGVPTYDSAGLPSNELAKKQFYGY